MENAQDFIAVEPRKLPIDGVEVTIDAVRVRKLPRVTALIQPLLDDLVLMPEGLFDTEGAEQDVGRKINAMSWMLDLVTRRGEDVITLVAFAVDQPEEWVGNLYTDRLVALAVEAVEMNVDFFSRAAPGIRARVERAKASARPKPAAATGRATPTPSNS